MSTPAKQVIFVAGVFNNYDKDIMRENIKRIAGYCAKLLDDDICCVSPVLFGVTILEYFNLPSTFSRWEKLSYDYIDMCTEMHVLCSPGWEKSRGVQSEIIYAEKTNKPVYYKPI